MNTATPKARRHSLSEPLPAGAVHVVMLAPLYTPLEGPVGAAGMRARGIAVGLQGRGHQVTVICAMPRGVEPDPMGGVEILPTAWVDLENLARAAGSKSGTLVQSRRSGSLRHTLIRSTASRILPDRYATWVPAAVRAARRAVGDDSLIFSTGSRSSHVVARLARGQHPWIADLNDLWSRNPHSDAHHLRERYEQFWEHQTVGAATRLTTVNELMSEELERRYRSKGAVTAIFSGFEPSDFDGLTHTPSTSGPVRILFGGTVYPRLNLEPLYQALRAGKTAGWLSADRLQISFVGRLSERVTLEASEFGVVDLIEASGLIPRAELLEGLVSADALLLPLYEVDPYALPMRFFEYVGAGRPIIGFGPADRIAGKLIQEYSLGVIASNAEEVERVLHQLVDDRASLPVPDPAVRAEFTWNRSIDKLDQLVRSVAAKGSDA